jgi:hypothetical protein
MKRFLLGGLLSALLLSSAFAQGFSVTITVDENGSNGTVSNTNGFFSTLPVSRVQDPGPGGLAAALTYNLLNPPGLTAGDLILVEPGGTGTVSDIIRYNPQQNGGSLVFYSDKTPGDTPPDLADIGFPTALYANTLLVTEVGAEGNNGLRYTPTAGQPGFVAGAGGPVTYLISSDVPEPSSILLLVTVIGIVSYRVGWHRRRPV